MAQPGKGWEAMVEREYEKWLDNPQGPGWFSISHKVLSRQHAAFVRLVKKLQKPYLSCRTEEQRSRYAERADMCAEILAALQQGGGKK